MNIKKGDKVKITFCPQEEFINCTGTVVKTLNTIEGKTLYKIRSNGKIIRNYATIGCISKL